MTRKKNMVGQVGHTYFRGAYPWTPVGLASLPGTWAPPPVWYYFTSLYYSISYIFTSIIQYKDNLVTDIDIVSITLKSSFLHIVFKFRVEDAVDVEVKMETWNHFKRKLELLEYNQIRPNEQCIIIWWTLYIIWPSNHHLQVYHNLVFHYYKIIHHYNFNQYNYYHNHYTLYKVMSLPWIFASTMVSCRQNKVQCIL